MVKGIFNYFHRMNFFAVRTLSVLSFATISACTNFNVDRLPSSISGSDIGVSPVLVSGGAFVLSEVHASADGSGSSFDLIGMNGEFDNFCTGSATCQCKFTYTQTNVGTVEQSTTIDYQESDLIRCSNPIPAGISPFTVQVVNSNTLASNELSISMNNNTFGGSSMYLDLTKPDSYLMAQRFQCRSRQSIMNIMSGNIIDPFQSEDPDVMYPFNFYTTNISETILKMQKGTPPQWQCSLTPTYDYTLPEWANPYVFSAESCVGNSFCNGDAELIYPTNDLTSEKIPVTNVALTGKSRSSFFLAKQNFGVFDAPVRAMNVPVGAHGPLQDASTNELNAYGAIIGYGARPIPNSNQTSSCPNIQLPPNSRWVKLWQFRATNLEQPQIVVGSQAVQQTGGIACFAGDTDIFPGCKAFDCDDTSNGMGWGPATCLLGSNNSSALWVEPTATNTLDAMTASNSFTCSGASCPGLVDRITVLSSAFGGGGPTPNACYQVVDDITSSNDGFGEWRTSGEEQWIRGNFLFNFESVPDLTPMTMADAVTDSEWGMLNSLPWGISLDKTTFWNGAPPEYTYDIPKDTNLDIEPLLGNSDPGNFTDYLFVLTPASVNDSSMINNNLPQYRPVTYRKKADCASNSAALCGDSNKVEWGILTTGFGNGAANSFPLCVLQFYE